MLKRLISFKIFSLSVLFFALPLSIASVQAGIKKEPVAPWWKRAIYFVWYCGKKPMLKPYPGVEVRKWNCCCCRKKRFQDPHLHNLDQKIEAYKKLS